MSEDMVAKKIGQVLKASNTTHHINLCTSQTGTGRKGTADITGSKA